MSQISLSRRPVSLHEQPHVLHDQLQRAAVVDSVPAAAPQRFRPEPVYGLPHGVTDAIVYARNIRIDRSHGIPEIFFCHSHGYVVDGRTVKGADGGHYPPCEDTDISAGCRIPADGFHTARMRVGVNGAVHVHFEAFDVEVPELQTADA